MNTTYLIGIILIAAIVLPIVLLNYKNNKKNAVIRKEYSEMTKSANIANQERWNGHLIAIDKIDKKCYFIHQEDIACETQIIDLTEYSSCRVITSSSLGSVSTSVEMVELVFTPKTKEKENINLVFYNADTDGFTLNGELQSAERWKKICNDCMN